MELRRALRFGNPWNGSGSCAVAGFGISGVDTWVLLPMRQFTARQLWM